MATTMCSMDSDETPTGFELDHRETINELVTQLGTDYAEYVKINYDGHKHALDETIDDMLTRLDEFCGMIDMVRSDDALCLTKTLPSIYAKSQELEHLYQRIDKLEAFIGVVRSNLEVMEAKVTEAECLLGGSSVKKLLTSLQKPLFSKKSTNGLKKKVNYEPPDIFKTSDYFGSVSTTTPMVKESSVMKISQEKKCDETNDLEKKELCDKEKGNNEDNAEEEIKET